jgi:heptaprenyl diphosphate synthase
MTSLSSSAEVALVRFAVPAGAQGSAGNTRIRSLVLLGVLSAAAAALQVIEAPLPRFLPWLKPGLANALVLFALVRRSWAFGTGIVLVRTLLAGTVLGIVFAPPFWLSLVGGLAAAGVMGLGLRLAGGLFGLAGISVLGAVANNLAQLSLVEAYFPGSFPLGFHLAVMLWVAVPSGLIVARITAELLRRIP